MTSSTNSIEEDIQLVYKAMESEQRAANDLIKLLITVIVMAIGVIGVITYHIFHNYPK